MSNQASRLNHHLIFFVSIIGVQLFQGNFRRACVVDSNPPVVLINQVCGGQIDPVTLSPKGYFQMNGDQSSVPKGYICPLGQRCLQQNVNPHFNFKHFDNILAASLEIFIVASTNGWAPLMYNMMDADYFVSCLFFIVCVIILNFWLINLFVGVITSTFSNIRAETNRSAFGAETWVYCDFYFVACLLTTGFGFIGRWIRRSPTRIGKGTVGDGVSESICKWFMIRSTGSSRSLPRRVSASKASRLSLHLNRGLTSTVRVYPVPPDYPLANPMVSSKRRARDHCGFRRRNPLAVHCCQSTVANILYEKEERSRSRALTCLHSHYYTPYSQHRGIQMADCLPTRSILSCHPYRSKDAQLTRKCTNCSNFKPP